MSRAPACRRQSQSMVYFFAPDLNDTLFVGEGKNRDKDHKKREPAGSREGKARDGQGEKSG